MVDALQRLNLVHEGLTDVPSKIVKKYGNDVKHLDLSYNNIQDFRFLLEMPNIEMLILDHNGLTAHVKLPHLSKLHTLWANHNDISNLAIFVSTLRRSCPSLQQLSLMNNEAAPSYFNGGSYTQYKDYRHFVISQLKNLEVLDDTRISREERGEAERIYAQHLPHVPTTFTPTRKVEFEFGIAPQDTPDLQIHNQAFSNFKSP